MEEEIEFSKILATLRRNFNILKVDDII